MRCEELDSIRNHKSEPSEAEFSEAKSEIIIIPEKRKHNN
jgi:hypothetical protein